MKSLNRFSGYLTIDHRSSPGTEAVPEGTLKENDIQQCCHCGRGLILESSPWAVSQRKACLTCDHYRCSRPGCIECIPYMKRLDLIEKYILSGGSDPLVKETLLLTGKRYV